jgi:hypothetical protein
VIVRYHRGGEDLAKALECRLAARGLTVKYRQRGDTSECAHEQIISTSYRADDDMTAKLKGAVSELTPFAVSVNLDPRAASDFVVILSPSSTIAAPDPIPKLSDAQDAAAESSTPGKKAGTTLSR